MTLVVCVCCAFWVWAYALCNPFPTSPTTTTGRQDLFEEAIAAGIPRKSWPLFVYDRMMPPDEADAGEASDDFVVVGSGSASAGAPATPQANPITGGERRQALFAVVTLIGPLRANLGLSLARSHGPALISFVSDYGDVGNRWIPDAEAAECMRCSRAFTLFRRKVA